MHDPDEPVFGPVFFATRLHALVRSACPDPAERVPVVLLRLPNGDEVDVCHILAIEPHYLVVAAYDRSGDLVEKDGMVTRFLPYTLVCEVIVAPAAPSRFSMGFHADPTVPAEAPRLSPPSR